MWPTLIVMAALAAPSLTLEQALEAAEYAQADTRVARLAVEDARAAERASWSGVLPRVDLGASAGVAYSAPQTSISTFPVANANGDIEFQANRVELPGFVNPSFGMQLRLTQPIWDGGRNWAQLAQAGSNVSFARAQAAEARLNVRRTAMRLFFDVLRAERQREVLVQDLGRAQEQATRADGLFAAGRSSRAEQLAARVAVAQGRAQLLQQDARIRVASASLAAAIGRPLAEEFTVVGPTNLPPARDLKDIAGLGQQAVDSRPAIVALRSQIEALSSAERIARADWFPKVSLGLGYQRFSPNPLLVLGDPRRQFTLQGSVDLNWNIFAGGLTRETVARAELASSQAQARLEAAELEVRGGVEAARRQLAGLQEVVPVLNEARQLARESLELAEARFRAGAGSQLEVRDAQVRLAQSELSIASMELDLTVGALELEAALGRL